MPSSKKTSTSHRWLSFFLILIVLVSILLLTVGGAVWSGYQAGLTQRQNQWQATQAVELERQYELGLTDLAAGHFELAVQRFEYILRLDPNYPGVAEKLVEAKVALQITPTATPLPTLVPIATGDAPASIFALAQQSYTAQNWDDVILRLTQLRALDMNYEAQKVDGMLFAALRNRGVARIQAKDLEGGIFDLNQAEAFGKLDAEASSHRVWARYYLDAQSYWVLNWPKTIELLSELHSFAPYFHDTAAKLYEARVTYADQLAAAGNYCQAAALYTDAQAQSVDQSVADKLATAQGLCVPTPEATATPDAVSTNTATP